MEKLNINKLVISNTKNLIVAVPYLLGYEPKNALSFLLSGQQQNYILAAVPADLELSQIISLVKELSNRINCEKIYALGFSPKIDFWQLIRELEIQLAPLSLLVFEINDTQYRSSPLDNWSNYDSDNSEFLAQLVFNGLQKLESRNALVEKLNVQLDFKNSVFQETAAAVVSYLRDTKKEPDKIILELIQNYAKTTALPNSFDRILILQLLQNPDIRDIFWQLYAIHNAKYWLRWWQAIYPFAYGKSSQYVLVFLGIAAWLNGNGVLSNIYYEKLLSINSAFAQSCMLYPVVNSMLPAEAWENSIKKCQGFRCIFSCCTGVKESVAIA